MSASPDTRSTQAITRLPGHSNVAGAFLHHVGRDGRSDAYADRQSLAEITEGYADVLALHERYGVPAGLQLDGTLLETLAHQRPALLERTRELREAGLLSLIGGAWSARAPGRSRGARGFDDHLALYERHLGCPPAEVTLCSIQASLSKTDALWSQLGSEQLRNGGYRYLLLGHGRLYVLSESRLVPVPGAGGLLPGVPPRSEKDWRLLERTVNRLVSSGGERLLLYAEDLERTAGIAGWEVVLGSYEAFLAWVASPQVPVSPVHLGTWLHLVRGRLAGQGNPGAVSIR
ncbi:MAG: toprim domain-containing protein [Actinomycetota bacterium]|nr:toprim domain-containing protein [Actinomycetota bacterium]MDQ2981920.1 toprim domain-containing protein [Actinomycetota bacterium]